MWHVAGQIGIFQKDMGLRRSEWVSVVRRKLVWGGRHLLGARKDVKTRQLNRLLANFCAKKVALPLGAVGS